MGLDSYHLMQSDLESNRQLFHLVIALEYCYHNLRAPWSKLGRSVYAQGQGFSRSELRSKMVEEEDILLLGAESFWKGFDAKGPCLSQVILTRLPFENPGHPIMEAKTERLEAEGKSAFMEITIPKAVIRFRQGIGRLIRSHTDIGDLLILDSRILNKRYGAHFLSELPNANFDTEAEIRAGIFSNAPMANGDAGNNTTGISALHK